jgi:hypothetical protein
MSVAKAGIRSTAEAYAYETIRGNKRAKQIAKAKTPIAPIRQAMIEHEIKRPNDTRRSSVHNAIQFAKFMNVSKPAMVKTLYGGLVRGTVNGIKDNWAER